MNERRYLDEPIDPTFKLTAVVTRAAVPNLMAEVLHPDCHWSISLDNTLPLEGALEDVEEEEEEDDDEDEEEALQQ